MTKKYNNLLIYFKKWDVMETNIKYVFQSYKGDECIYSGQIWKGTRNGWGY